MSSATPFERGAGRRVIDGSLEQANGRIARLGMSPRQQRLNYYYAHYRGQCYDARQVDWDGSPRVDHIDREAIARKTFVPPGFDEVSGSLLPLKFRRPTAPYSLVKVIVDRFTGLLFSERRHPQLRVEGDPDTEDYVRTLAEVARLWPAMIQARSFGGSCGSVVVGFQFIAGKPVVEPHDPRHVFPTFSDRASMKLKSIEKRYYYPEDVFDREQGKWIEVSYWYRRIVDEERDVLWNPVPVGDGDEPDWDRLERKEVEHGLGFCPAVWVQNVPVADDVDGDPDCHCVYDLIEAIDALVAQANRGTLANCDPTLVLSAPNADGVSDLSKGSGNAITGPTGTEAKYLELAGTGAKSAMELAEDLRKKALEVAQVVLDHPDTAQRTATEIERTYSSMLAKADVLREQYGERCVKPIMEMMVEAARKVTRSKRNGATIERGTLDLPDRFEVGDKGIARTARRLGPGGVLKLQWPGYFEPGLTDVETAVRAANEAKAGSLIDQDHASKFVAEYFRVEDVRQMTKKMTEEREQDRSMLDQQMMGRIEKRAKAGMDQPAPPDGEEDS